MPDTQTQLQEVVQKRITFPLQIEADGRQFSIQSAGTRRVWELYMAYEAMLVQFVPETGKEVPELTRAQAMNLSLIHI